MDFSGFILDFLQIGLYVCKFLLDQHEEWSYQYICQRSGPLLHSRKSWGIPNQNRVTHFSHLHNFKGFLIFFCILVAFSLAGVPFIPALLFWRNLFAVLSFLEFSYFLHFFLRRMAGMIYEIPPVCAASLVHSDSGTICLPLAVLEFFRFLDNLSRTG